MNLDEYAREDATGLAQLLRRREVTAAELSALAVEAIGRVNPALNALAGPLFEPPLQWNRDAPLSGVPFLIKDLVLHAGGEESNLGSRLFKGLRFPHDTELMRRFRNAGLVTLGRTTTPEFGFNSSTEAVLHGPTHNPWRPGLTPGGSSGGSAALVAAGAVPLAHANDGGGSIRIPAACCGLVGLKPSRGRIPLGPDFDMALSGLGIEFAVTRTVRDARLLLDLLSGPAAGEFIPVGHPEPARAPRGLRIAWSARPQVDVPVDPQVEAALRQTAALLEDMGHIVEEADMPVDRDQLFDMTLTLWTAFLAELVFDLAPALGCTPTPAEVEPASWACAEYGRGLSAIDLLHAESQRNAVTRGVVQWMGRYDLFLSPTLATPPWPLGINFGGSGDWTAESWTRQVFARCPYTALFNATGQPAISLPLATSGDGLPIGMQLVGAWGTESLLLGMAAELETAWPWHGRRPAIHVAGQPAAATA